MTLRTQVVPPSHVNVGSVSWELESVNQIDESAKDRFAPYGDQFWPVSGGSDKAILEPCQLALFDTGT
jgi:hypothetical protein